MSDQAMHSSELDESRNTPKKLKGKKTKVKSRRKFRMADIKVGTMLLWVLAMFMVLLIGLGGLGGYFLWQNMDPRARKTRQPFATRCSHRFRHDVRAGQPAVCSPL